MIPPPGMLRNFYLSHSISPPAQLFGGFPSLHPQDENSCSGWNDAIHPADSVYQYHAYWVGVHHVAEVLTDKTLQRARQSAAASPWREKDSLVRLLAIARTLKQEGGASPSAQAAGVVELPPGAGGTGEDSFAVVWQRSNSALLKAMHTLSTQQQECLTLRFLLDLSVSDTARTLGRQEGAVRTLQYRAIRTLKGRLRANASCPEQLDGKIQNMLHDCGRHYRAHLRSYCLQGTAAKAVAAPAHQSTRGAGVCP